MFGKKVNNTRVVQVSTKIVLAFSLFLLISNFTTNYINLIYNRTELIKLEKQLLQKDLKSLYSYCNNQYQIFQFDNDYEGSIASIEKKGLHELKRENAVVLGFNKEGKVLFQSSKIK